MSGAFQFFGRARPARLRRVYYGWWILAAFGLVSVGYSIWSGTGLATVGLWFSRRRGLAMGVVTAGSALGGLLVPVWQHVVTVAGWRSSFVVAGLLMLVVGGGVALILQ